MLSVVRINLKELVHRVRLDLIRHHIEQCVPSKSADEEAFSSLVLWIAWGNHLDRLYSAKKWLCCVFSMGRRSRQRSIQSANFKTLEREFIVFNASDAFCYGLQYLPNHQPNLQ
jgi:hypothetical protein